MFNYETGIFFLFKANIQILQIGHHHVYLLDRILNWLHIQIIKDIQMSDRFQLFYFFLSFTFHERFCEEAFKIIFTQV